MSYIGLFPGVYFWTNNSILAVLCILEAKILSLLVVKIFQMTVFGEFQLSLVQGSQKIVICQFRTQYLDP